MVRSNLPPPDTNRVNQKRFGILSLTKVTSIAAFSTLVKVLMHHLLLWYSKMIPPIKQPSMFNIIYVVI